MPQSITVNFPVLTDTVVAFASVGAWNSYFGAVTITIDGVNLPAATGSTIGAVFEAQNADSYAWTDPNYSAGQVITAYDTGGNTYNFTAAAQSDLAQAVVNITQLRAAIDDLITKLQTAGIMLTS